MGGYGGWEEKWGLKLTSAKVEDKVDAELDKKRKIISGSNSKVEESFEFSLL